jgi:hypothetical protein
MSFVEFKNNVNLIILFITKLNEENIPHDIKRTMVKVYANTLSINLSDKMADSIIETIFCSPETAKQAITA